MKFSNLIFKSLSFYRRTHVGVILGAAIGTAVLTGALIVGDSVKASLHRLSSLRLGKTKFALAPQDRFFRTQLADELSKLLKTDTAPVLKLNGIGSDASGQERVNRVYVLGVDSRFWEMGEAASPFENIKDDEAVINQRLAERLHLDVGDEFLLRVEKISLLPGDVPLTSSEKRSIALRLIVKSIATDERFGRFDLRINQVSPYSVFLPLDVLAEKTDLAKKANILLVADNAEESVSLAGLDEALSLTWQLEDAGLQIRRLPDFSGYELISHRIFLEPPVVDASVEGTEKFQGLLTYFANTIHHGNRETPYSFVSAPGPPIVPENMNDDEIIINRWLAEDIRASRGDSISVAYYLPEEGHRLIEKAASFRVKSIISLRGAAMHPTLTPTLPGLTDTENCRDWDPGIAIDLDKIRAKDEIYWDTYHATPKAFITLNAAQTLWGNRFGNLTAIRFQGSELSKRMLETRILDRLSPASIGLFFTPVRQEAQEASSEAIDFGQLFLGLSFFVILAALLLTELLFSVTVEHRSEETGSLLAMGYKPKHIHRLLLAEGSILAGVGGVLGAFLGILLNQAIILLLATVWRGVVGQTSLIMHVKPITLGIGAGVGILLGTLTMWIAVSRQTKKTIQDLHRPVELISTKKGLWPLILSLIALLGVVLIFSVVHPGKDREAASAFWMAGFLMLLSSISMVSWLLDHTQRATRKMKFHLLGLTWRNMIVKKSRSLSTLAILACGVFVIVAVGANRQGRIKDPQKRGSGTGGFALYGETTIPVVNDLNARANRRKLGLSESAYEHVSFVPLRVKEGDDASCLNLNRIRMPAILGTDPEELSKRDAFAFSETVHDMAYEGNPWRLLQQNLEENVIPAVADQTVIVWGLGKSVGDTLYTTNERGTKIGLRLVGGLSNSIFQGGVLIGEKAFKAHFPSISGSRVLLIDAPPEITESVNSILSRTMQDDGLELTDAAKRLAAFNVVTNTYLTIFLALGGLGLIIGTVGMGVIVFRNVMERRKELALLRAVGYPAQSVRGIVMMENLLLLWMGITAGTASALIAVLPAILSPGSEIPYATIGLIVIVILASGALWTILASALATKKDLIPALRNE